VQDADVTRAFDVSWADEVQGSEPDHHPSCRLNRRAISSFMGEHGWAQQQSLPETSMEIKFNSVTRWDMNLQW